MIEARQNSMNDIQCLKGLQPVVEDWHAKLCFLIVRILSFNFNNYHYFFHITGCIQGAV